MKEKKNNKVVCVYDRTDLDGLFGAAVALHFFKERIDLRPWYYKETLPDLSQYETVYFVDLAPTIQWAKRICETAQMLFIVDHHKSAIEEYMVEHDRKKLPDNLCFWKPNILPTGEREKLAGCELLWKLLTDGTQEMPKILSEAVGAYDTFRHVGTKEESMVNMIEYGLRYMVKDPWTALMYMTDSWKITRFLAKSHGETLYINRKIQVHKRYKKGIEVVFVDAENKRRVFLMINDHDANPKAFDYDYMAHGYDGAGTYAIKGNDPVFTFTLYSEKEDVDCSAIAKNHGGGGHRGAAGFTVPLTELRNYIS